MDWNNSGLDNFNIGEEIKKMINETLTEQIIQSRAEIYPTALIGIWAVFLLVLFFVTLIIKENKKWGDFKWIFISTAIITGIILFFVVSMPEQLNQAINGLIDFFK